MLSLMVGSLDILCSPFYSGYLTAVMVKLGSRVYGGLSLEGRVGKGEVFLQEMNKVSADSVFNY